MLDGLKDRAKDGVNDCINVGEKLKDGDKLGSALGFIDGTIEDVGVLVTVGDKEDEILRDGIELGWPLGFTEGRLDEVGEIVSVGDKDGLLDGL